MSKVDSSRRLVSPVLMVAACCLLALGARAEEPADLVGMSLEELTNMQVTTASRQGQNLFETAASVHVVTSDDIRRSGARTVPDMLRLIPGVQVAQINAHLWAVSVRGFNWTYASKLLVMIDGRTVYTPLTSGVDWDSMGLLPENIDRIEVVRGSGASVWGANAVNGVINILTKTAVDTRGTLAGVRLGAGDAHEVFVRHGGDLGKGAYRTNVRLTDSPSLEPLLEEEEASASMRSANVGFRYDRELREGSLMVDFDATRSTYVAATSLVLADAPYMKIRSFDASALDASVLARWIRRRDRGDLTLQFFHARHDRDQGDFRNSLSTTDVDAQVSSLRGRHALVWGGSVRLMSDRTDTTGSLRMTAENDTSGLWSVFIQDDIRLPVRNLHLIVGTRIEHHESVGFEVQPHARLLWRSPHSRHAAWAAVTKASRTPSRVDRALDLDIAAFPMQGMTAMVRGLGDEGLDAERVVSQEIGYRFRTARRFEIDLSLFRGDYRGIISAVEGDPFLDATGPQPLLILPLHLANALRVQTSGAEIAMRWEPAPWVSIDAAASWIRFDVESEPGSAPSDGSFLIDGQTPSDQQSLRAHFRVRDGITLDASWEHVGRLSEGAPERHDIGLGLDVRLGAHASLRIQGHRLFSSEHVEFATAEGSQLKRFGPSGSLLFTWKF